jgi:hypothetical protein
MSRVLWIMLTLLVLVVGERFVVADAPDLPSPRLPRDNLLLFRGEEKQPLQVRTVDDWLQRRDEIRRGMQAVMGPLPGEEKRCPLDVQIEREADAGSYVIRTITYASEPDSRVPAYLLIPKEALQPEARFPAVLAPLGTGMSATTFSRQARETDGFPLFGDGRDYPRELAERGYVILVPAYPHLGEYRPDLAGLGYQSGTMKAIWDNIRGLDLLDSLPFVQPGRFGAIGHSLGGHNSVYTSVFDERIKAVVSSCGLDSFLDYYDGNEQVWMPGKGWTQERYMPRLAQYRNRLEEIPFDFHEVIGSLAPRHVLISAPLNDGNFRHESVDRVAAAASEIYKLYDVPERLRVEHPDCGHNFPDEVRALAYKLFDAVLQ